MSLYKNFFSVGSMTLLSRIMGFVRDIMIAGLLGTSMAADAFFAAFRFPNLFRRLFAEGAFNAAFIPLFSGVLEREGEEAAGRFASRIISWLVLFLFGVLILTEIFMPQIMAWFVPGFVADEEKFNFTVLLARICFPYLALMSVMSAYGAMLNGLGKFLAAAFAPVMLNIVLVIILGFLVFFITDKPAGAVFLALGVIIGGFAQVAIVVWALYKTGLFPYLRWPVFGPDIARFFALALPVMFSGGITQINIFVGTIIASGAASTISYLYYADRLYQLPLGIIGIAIGVVLLPELSRHLKGNRPQQAALAQEKSLFLAMMLCLPAAAALFIMAKPIVQVLFERGAFDATATLATASALSAFSLGLPAFVLIKIFQPGFFAREDTMTPTILAAISVIINIAISLLLFPALAQTAIAIATSIAAWFNALFLMGILALRGHFSLRNKELRHHILFIIASMVMLAILWMLGNFAGAALDGSGSSLVQFGMLGLVLTIGMIAYFALLHLFGVVRLNQLSQQFRALK